MVEIQETALPGVGIRHDFLTTDGRRIGVISHRTGRRELFICKADDPDTPIEVIDLDREESGALADLLGGSKVVEQLSRLQQEVEGLAIDWIPIPISSPYVGRTLGETGARTRTGVSIVAILRDGAAAPAPGPDHTLAGEDTLVVVGTPNGITRLIELMHTG